VRDHGYVVSGVGVGVGVGVEVERPRGTADRDLLCRIATGEVAAIGDLYDRHAAILFPVALRILRDRGAAEDAVHDAFLLVADRAGQYSPERGSVVAWLILLVRNSCLDRARRESGASPSPPGLVQTTAELMTGTSERETVRRALSSLSENQQRTLEIAFFEGLTYAEIAAREGVPVQTIRSLAGQAIASLRAAFERDSLTAAPNPGQASAPANLEISA